MMVTSCFLTAVVTRIHFGQVSATEPMGAEKAAPKPLVGWIRLLPVAHFLNAFDVSFLASGSSTSSIEAF